MCIWEKFHHILVEFETLLGAFVLFDLCSAANLYAAFIEHASASIKWLLPVGLFLMFVVYLCYFLLHDHLPVSEAFAKSINSLVSSLPLLESEFDSVTLTYFLTKTRLLTKLNQK